MSTPTNLQDKILLNELNANGVYTVGGVLVPLPSPLTSAFGAAVTRASLLCPPILTYTGDVSGYDFVASGQSALTESLNKLVGLTINGNVSSAFNNISLKIRNIAINGGVNNSFNRSKVEGNITINGNVLFSFDNSILEGISSKSHCPGHGSLIITGNIGLSTENLIVLQLQQFVSGFAVAVPPATTPTVAQFQTAFNTTITTLSTGVASQFLAQLTASSVAINSYLNGLISGNPFTAANQTTVLANIIYSFFTQPQGVFTFINSIIKYDAITLTGVVITNSFLNDNINVDKLLVTYSNIYFSFTNSVIKGFEKVATCDNKFGITCWQPACSILFNLSNAVPTFSQVNSIFIGVLIETECLTIEGTFYGALFDTATVYANKIKVTSAATYSRALSLFTSSTVVAFELIDVEFPLGGTFVSLGCISRDSNHVSTFKFGKFIQKGQIIDSLKLANLYGHKLYVQGTASYVATTFTPVIMNVDYVCFDSLYQATNILTACNIESKEVVFKTDLSSATAVFQGPSPTYAKIQVLRFANGFNYSDSSLAGNMYKFDLCELIVEKCVAPGTTPGVILNLAFNGSVIEAERIIIKGDVSNSFNASTIRARELIAGNTYYSFASSLVDVNEVKFETAAQGNALNSGPCRKSCETLALLNLDTTNTSAVTALTTIINNQLYTTFSNAPTLTPFDTGFIVSIFKSGTFDRSNLNLIYHPKFVNLDIVVSNLVPYGQSTPTSPSIQFLVDAIIGTYVAATIVNGSTVTYLSAPAFSHLKFLKLVGTATVSQIPLTVLACLKEIEICTTVPLTCDEKKLLKKYHLI